MQCPYPVSIRNPDLDNHYGWFVTGDGSAINPRTGEVIPSRIPVPCGRCVICQENRRNMWADRLELESRTAPVTYFLTLTYDDLHYPGELCKRDTQLFWKRFRHKVKCRFFLCGEYGDRFQRGHYHAVCFPHSYISQEEFEAAARDAWGSGFIQCRLADREAFRYVAKYTVKSVGNTPEGKTPPFALMSRRPGISGSYLPVLQNYFHDYIQLENGTCRPLPDYLLEKLDPVEGIRIKEASREFARKQRTLTDSEKFLRLHNLERSLIRKYNRKHGTFTTFPTPGAETGEFAPSFEQSESK